MNERGFDAARGRDGENRASAAEAVLVAAALAVLAAYLLPTLAMPYLGDDTFNAYLDGWMGYDRLSLGDGFAHFFADTNTNVGRFYPIYPLLMFFDFHIVHNVLVLKLLVLTAIVLNAGTFYVLLRIVFPPFALPALVALPAALQIRFFHDPIVQFSLHMQVAWECSLLAAIALALYARMQKAGMLAAGAIAYLCAALTYEATYAFVVIYVAMAFGLIRSGRTRIAAVAAYVTVPLLCSGAAIVTRMYVPVPATSDYAIHYDLAGIARAMLLQTLGAVPLSYALSDPAKLVSSFATLVIGSRATIVLTICVLLLAVFSFRQRRPFSAKTAWWAIVCAVGLIVLAASLVSLSARWQRELVPGLAYTPVYFEAFGSALALGVFGRLLMRWLPRTVGIAAIAIVLAFFAGTTYRANALVLAHFYRWSTIEPDALDAGVLGAMQDGATLYIGDIYPANASDKPGRWNVRNFLFAHTGKRVRVQQIAALPLRPPPGAFALIGSITDFHVGKIAAGPIASVVAVNGVNEPLVEQAYTYASFARGNVERRVPTSHCGAMPLENQLDGISSALLLRYDGAFYAPEQDGAVPFRWASGPGVVTIANPTNRPRKAEVRFSVRAASAARHVRFRVGSGAWSDAPDDGADVVGALAVSIPARGSIAASFDSDNAPIAPGGRTLRYELRGITVREKDCR